MHFLMRNWIGRFFFFSYVCRLPGLFFYQDNVRTTGWTSATMKPVNFSADPGNGSCWALEDCRPGPQTVSPGFNTQEDFRESQHARCSFKSSIFDHFKSHFNTQTCIKYQEVLLRHAAQMTTRLKSIHSACLWSALTGGWSITGNVVWDPLLAADAERTRDGPKQKWPRGKTSTTAEKVSQNHRECSETNKPSYLQMSSCVFP